MIYNLFNYNAQMQKDYVAKWGAVAWDNFRKDMEAQRQAANLAFNQELWTAVAIVATVGIASGVAAGAGAATTDGAVAGGTTAVAPVSVAAPYAEVGYTGSAVVAPSSYGAVDTLGTGALENAGYGSVVSVAAPAGTSGIGTGLGSLGNTLVTTAEKAAAGAVAADVAKGLKPSATPAPTPAPGAVQPAINPLLLIVLGLAAKLLIFT